MTREEANKSYNENKYKQDKRLADEIFEFKNHILNKIEETANQGFNSLHIPFFAVYKSVVVSEKVEQAVIDILIEKPYNYKFNRDTRTLSW